MPRFSLRLALGSVFPICALVAQTGCQTEKKPAKTQWHYRDPDIHFKDPGIHFKDPGQVTMPRPEAK